MTETLAELIAASRQAASADARWLGSGDHRALLESALTEVFALPEASLSWGPPGEQGSSLRSTQQIVLERPLPLPHVLPEDVAEYTALSLLHECLHLRFSTRFDSYSAAKRALSPVVQGSVDDLFQLLEDGRITALGAAEDPALGPELGKFLDEAIRQAKLNSPSHEGTNPRSLREQLLFALHVHALQPGRKLTLHPCVQRYLEELEPIIERAHAGDTAACGRAAIELVEAVIKTEFPHTKAPDHDEPSIDHAPAARSLET